MELKFSLREIKKMIKLYYLEKEKSIVEKIKLYYRETEDSTDKYDYKITGTIILEKEVDNIKYIDKIKVNEYILKRILNNYLEPEGYIIEELHPILNSFIYLYLNDSIAGIRASYNKIEKEENKKLVRKQ